jgi:hypothetical protein
MDRSDKPNRRALPFTAAMLVAVALALAAAAASVWASDDQQQKNYVNSELPWHQAVLDEQGQLLAWHQPQRGGGFDKVLHLAWDFLEHQVPDDPRSGLKVYLVNAVFDAKTRLGTNWQGNPASTFAQFVDSLVAWYPYSGDREAIAVVRSMLDHQLAHGTSPADWAWPKVPFPTTRKNDPEYGRALRGMPEDFYGGIETDKVGELGMGYAQFYELTGERKYLDAALACADALAAHVRGGDETHTPWPFRLNARTGEVLNGEEYGGMIVAPVRLFSELIRLKAGDIAAYERARTSAWDWIMKYPMHNDRWSGYFEDVGKNTENVNQALPTMTAYYILSRPDPAAVDPHWNGDVGRLLDWVRRRFGRGPYLGAWAIDEQGAPPDYAGCCSRAGLASATSRWGAINAMYYERTGDLQARRDAFRSLNYATYFAADDGRIACCGLDYADSYWFDDGYGDHVRHYLWAMGAIPEFAPAGEDHLLRCSSVVTHITYGKSSIEYKTFDEEATVVLRLRWRPKEILAGAKPLAAVDDASRSEGYTIRALPGGDFVLRVHARSSREVTLALGER